MSENFIDLGANTNHHELMTLGFSSIDGDIVYEKKPAVVIHKKIGDAFNTKSVKLDSVGGLHMLEMFENTYSGQVITYLISCKGQKLTIDELHSQFKFVIRGSFRIRRNDIKRKTFTSEKVYTKDDLDVMVKFFEMYGAAYFVKKVSEFECTDDLGRAKFSSRNVIVLDHKRSFKITG